LALAAGGDDYALVCAVDPADESAFAEAVLRTGSVAAAVGRFRSGSGLEVLWDGEPVAADRKGWRHS
jgi:thiamine monophosphate kinase